MAPTTEEPRDRYYVELYGIEKIPISESRQMVTLWRGWAYHDPNFGYRPCEPADIFAGLFGHTWVEPFRWRRLPASEHPR